MFIANVCTLLFICYISFTLMFVVINYSFIRVGLLLCSLQMVHTHRNLLSQWRKRAVMNQSEARRVLAEMLTPSGE